MKMRKVQWVTKDQVFLTWEAEDRQVLVILLVRQVAPPAPAQWVAKDQVFIREAEDRQVLVILLVRKVLLLLPGECMSSEMEIQIPVKLCINNILF